MITKEDLTKNYKRFSDYEIIKLYEEHDSLSDIAIEVLNDEVKTRNLNLTPIIRKPVIKEDENPKLNNTALYKKYYISKRKLKTIAYRYFSFCLFMVVLSFIFSFDSMGSIFIIITFS